MGASYLMGVDLTLVSQDKALVYQTKKKDINTRKKLMDMENPFPDMDTVNNKKTKAKNLDDVKKIEKQYLP